jgi:hypothetical protein
MSPPPTLYELEPGRQRDELTVTPVWSQDEGGPLAPDYRHLVALQGPVDAAGDGAGHGRPGGEAHLLAVDGDGKAAVFAVGAGEPRVTPVDADIDLSIDGPSGPLSQWDIVRSFVIGDTPHLLTYAAAEPGQFAFFPLTADLRSRRPYLFSRRREPGPTGGFDVVEPIVVGGLVYYMCYGFDSGRVVIYALQVTATGLGGGAPLVSRAVWVHEWAARWTRFAFFRFGAGTYFLKTNVGRLNVNIDHVLDDPSQGAVEVGAHLDLQDALELDMVRPYTSPQGDPGFVTYKDDGATTFNRFHGDCEGWTTEAALTTVAGATHLVPMAVAHRRLVLLY